MEERLANGLVKERPLKVLLTRFREGSLKLRVGTTTALVDLVLSQFLRKRACGMRSFFNLVNM